MLKRLRIFACVVFAFISSSLLHAQQSEWTVNPHDYQYDMTAYVQLVLDGSAVSDYSNYVVGAFVGDECRGVGEPDSQVSGGETYRWLYVRVRSNSASGEKVTFRLYDKTTDEIKKLAETIDFSAEGQVGGPSNPQNLRLLLSISATSADETKGTVAAVPTGEVAYGTEITVTATPIDGYSFVNWTSGETEVSTENPYTFSLKATTELTGNFKPRKYDVKFIVDGNETVQSLDYGTVITKPENPTKQGYTFQRWSPEFTEGVTVPVDGITYTAVWTVNRHTITFNTNGGSTIEPMTLDYGSTITLPANPTREGYKFTGWAETVPTTMPDNDLTLTAQWQIQKYDVTFVVDNNVVKSESLEFGAEIVAPDVAEKEGYTFTGWSPDLLQRVPSRAVTFTAQFKLNVYTLTYYINGEVAYTTQVEYGAAITEFTPEIGQGYVFNGWQETIPRTMPAHNVEIHGTTSVDTTGIAAVVSACGGCADVYNLQGRLVLRNADISSVSRLPKGLYIVNGVKCVKK